MTLKPTGVRVPSVHPASPDVPHPKGKDLGADIWALIHEGVVRGDSVAAPRNLTGTVHVQS